jgi:predicted metalloprotease with PDZ domain
MFEVDIRIKRSNPAAVESLIMPVWTPGSYLVREFERNVQDFSAKDATGPGTEVGEDQQEHLAHYHERRN